MEWKPEFVVAVIEANLWATRWNRLRPPRLIPTPMGGRRPSEKSGVLDAAILAGLASAVDPLLSRVQSQAALAADVRHLMEALLPWLASLATATCGGHAG